MSSLRMPERSASRISETRLRMYVPFGDELMPTERVLVIDDGSIQSKLRILLAKMDFSEIEARMLARYEKPGVTPPPQSEPDRELLKAIEFGKNYGAISGRIQSRHPNPVSNPSINMLNLLEKIRELQDGGHKCHPSRSKCSVCEVIRSSRPVRADRRRALNLEIQSYAAD